MYTGLKTDIVHLVTLIHNILDDNGKVKIIYRKSFTFVHLSEMDAHSARP